MYQVHHHILNPLTSSHRQHMILMDMDMDIMHRRHRLLVATILCNLELLMDWILLLAYLDGIKIELRKKSAHHGVPTGTAWYNTVPYRTN